MKLLQKYEKEVTAFVKVCHRLAQNMYAISYGGNLAWKLEEDLILITPTRMNKGDIGAGHVVFINTNGDTVEGGRRPTGEKPMYLRFFKEREDVVSVIHCHPPCVCAAAIMKGKNWLERPFFPEAVIEVGPAPVVPYAEPLTEQLGRNFSPYLRKYNSFIMENHGLLTMSRSDIEWTFVNVELFEATAHSLLLALAAGEIKELSREDVINLDNTMKARDLVLFGAPGTNNSLLDLYFPQG